LKRFCFAGFLAGCGLGESEWMEVEVESLIGGLSLVKPSHLPLPNTRVLYCKLYCTNKRRDGRRTEQERPGTAFERVPLKQPARAVSKVLSCQTLHRYVAVYSRVLVRGPPCHRYSYLVVSTHRTGLPCRT
jgi:hypothetical protein